MGSDIDGHDGRRKALQGTERVSRDAVHLKIHFIAETTTEAWRLAFIPINRLNQFGARGRQEENRTDQGVRAASSACKSSHFTARATSSSKLIRRRSSSRCCASGAG